MRTTSAASYKGVAFYGYWAIYTRWLLATKISKKIKLETGPQDFFARQKALQKNMV